MDPDDKANLAGGHARGAQKDLGFVEIRILILDPLLRGPNEESFV